MSRAYFRPARNAVGRPCPFVDFKLKLFVVKLLELHATRTDVHGVMLYRPTRLLFIMRTPFYLLLARRDKFSKGYARQGALFPALG